MTEITLRPLLDANRADLNRCDNSFTVERVLHLHAADLSGSTGNLTYTVEPVTPYVKHYGPEVYAPDDYLGRADRAGWIAYVDGQVAGQILVHENWNRLAIIWDIAVAPPFRRMGVGRRLLAQAVAWARERGLPGVMLETQNINAGACGLYESCGFVLGGVDRHLYAATNPGEIALFWYLLF